MYGSNRERRRGIDQGGLLVGVVRQHTDLVHQVVITVVIDGQFQLLALARFQTDLLAIGVILLRIKESLDGTYRVHQFDIALHVGGSCILEGIAHVIVVVGLQHVGIVGLLHQLAGEVEGALPVLGNGLP